MRPLANALRIIFPPGPPALKVLTTLRVEVLGALVRVRGTLMLARRLPRELPRACRRRLGRRWRRRRLGRGRRQRRLWRRCANVTVIPVAAAHTYCFRAAPRTQAPIGVATETAWHTTRCKRGITHMCTCCIRMSMLAPLRFDGGHSLFLLLCEPILRVGVFPPTSILNAAPPLASFARGGLCHVAIIV